MSTERKIGLAIYSLFFLGLLAYDENFAGVLAIITLIVVGASKL